MSAELSEEGRDIAVALNVAFSSFVIASGDTKLATQFLHMIGSALDNGSFPPRSQWVLSNLGGMVQHALDAIEAINREKAN